MSRTNRAKRQRKAVSLARMPFGGDHGPNTKAATAGTVLEPLTDDQGRNPNNMARRRRKNVIDDMIKRKTLTMRQHQAAMAIQEAFCRVEMLSSGGPIKERVQASPKPDATISVQVDSRSRLVHVMKPVKRSDRDLVECVCWHNKPLASAIRGGYVRGYTRFRDALDAVADHLGY